MKTGACCHLSQAYIYTTLLFKRMSHRYIDYSFIYLLCKILFFQNQTKSQTRIIVLKPRNNNNNILALSLIKSKLSPVQLFQGTSHFKLYSKFTLGLEITVSLFINLISQVSSNTWWYSSMYLLHYVSLFPTLKNFVGQKCFIDK